MLKLIKINKIIEYECESRKNQNKNENTCVLSSESNRKKSFPSARLSFTKYTTDGQSKQIFFFFCYHI